VATAFQDAPAAWQADAFQIDGVAPAPPARAARYRWRDDTLAALAWRDEAAAAYAWREPPTAVYRWDDDAAVGLRWQDEAAESHVWGDDMASVNHLSQHVGSAKRFTFTPSTPRAGANPYGGVQPQLTVCDRPGDFLSADPPVILLRKTTGLSIDAATGVVTCDVTSADTLTIRAAAGLGGHYYYLEDVEAASPLVISHGQYSLESSALDAP
jgi:hypothetical protein